MGKIKNLIDFEECDVHLEYSAAAREIIGSDETKTDRIDTCKETEEKRPEGETGGSPVSDAALSAENVYLRQCLEDMREEQRITREMMEEEMAQKQTLIDDL